jgi:hypothetical protein
MRNCSKDWSRSEQEFIGPLQQTRSEARIAEHIGHVAASAAATGLIDRDPPGGTPVSRRVCLLRINQGFHHQGGNGEGESRPYITLHPGEEMAR